MAHGGARPGAGRKPFCNKTIPVSWRVSEKSYLWINAVASKRNVPIGAVLDEILDVYISVSNLIEDQE